MFGLGVGEIFLILVFALIFIGPKKLPELAQNLGKSLREFQKAKDDLMAQVHTETHHETHDVENHPQEVAGDIVEHTEEDSQGDHHSALTDDTLHEDQVVAETMDVKNEPKADSNDPAKEPKDV